jgi:uncharacterized protein YjbI with pentapeptide repeats
MNAGEIAIVLEEHARWLRATGDSRANLSRADLSGASLSRANLSRANLSRADLSGASLSRADLYWADLSRANLSGADLYEADLSRANLSGADLYEADLSRANLYEAYLSGADLSRANLSRANLYEADLSRANLSRANLYEADLSRANLSGANLSRADLYGTCLGVSQTPFDWATSNMCDMRCIGNRTLVLGVRTKNQPHMYGPEYDLSKLYKAPYFSRDPSTSCHPGLYVETGIDGSHAIRSDNIMLVAFWLDEMIIATKCRVPRFRTLSSREEFDSITPDDMERDNAPLSVYGWYV